MRLKREREEIQPGVSSSGMGDIAFLLIIFFMLATVIRAERGIPVTLPKAVATKKLPKKNLAHIWINQEGVISINDKIVPVEYVTTIMARKMKANPALIVSILMDKSARYGILSKVFDSLRDADALRVSLATLKEKGG